MFLFTKNESVDFLKSYGKSPDDWAIFERMGQLKDSKVVDFSEKKPFDFLSFSQKLVDSLGLYDECLMLVTGYGTWSSSENWHLFYQLRLSYGFDAHIRNKPGHLFLRTEKSDLVTYIYLSMLFGWDFHVVPVMCHSNAHIYVSHDEWLRFYSENEELLSTSF